MYLFGEIQCKASLDKRRFKSNDKLVLKPFNFQNENYPAVFCKV